MQIRVITSLLSAFGIIFGEIFLFTTRGKECNVRRVRRNATLPVSGKHGWLVGTVLPSGWKREDLHLLAICNFIIPTFCYTQLTREIFYREWSLLLPIARQQGCQMLRFV